VHCVTALCGGKFPTGSSKIKHLVETTNLGVKGSTPSLIKSTVRDSLGDWGSQVKISALRPDSQIFQYFI
jgi:hypothetical protein